MNNEMIRPVKIADARRIAEIYNYYIANTTITFEEDAIDAGEIERRIKAIGEKNYPYIVYEDSGGLRGYAYLNNWRTRSAYDITLETSIYVDINSINKSIGTVLYRALIAEAQKMDIHSLIGVISLPNDISRRLHDNLRFQMVGNFREAGKKFGKLIDVEFWQLILVAENTGE
jgi:phosphinothricin acetyltransferase